MADNPIYEEAIKEFVDLAIEQEKREYKSELEPFEAHAEKLRKKLTDGLHNFQKSYSHGYELLISEIQRLHPDRDLSHFQANTEKINQLDTALLEGKMLCDLLGFSSEALLTFFECATRLLEEKRYSDALDAFFFLVTIAPDVTEFWLDFGFCYAQLGQFEAAIEAYMRAIQIDQTAVDGYLAVASTYVKMQDFEQAVRTCEIGLAHALEHRREEWAEELASMLEEAKRQIEVLFNKSQYGTFTS